MMNSKAKKNQALPKGWREVKLNDVATIKTGPFGTQLHQHDYVHFNGTPIITVKHLSDGGLIHKNLPLVSSHDKKRLSQYLIQEGDIVFSRVGSVDRSTLVSKKESGWLFSGRLLRIRPRKSEICSPYLNYFFHTQKFRNHMRSIAVGGTMPSLNTGILSNVVISFPSVAEQKVIASLLKTWDTAIEKTEALIAAKQKRFKWLLKRLISDQQNNPDWRRVKLGDVLSYEQPTKYIVDSTNYTSTGAVAVLTANKSFILGYTNENRGIFDELPVIIFDDFTTATKYVDFPFKVKSSAMKILKQANNNVNLKFAFHSMQFIDFPLGGHQRYWISEYQHLEMKFPSLTKQKKIVSMLNAAQQEIELLKQLAEKHGIQKCGLMQKLLTGKWRVK